MSLNLIHYQHKQSKNIPIPSSLHLCFKKNRFCPDVMHSMVRQQTEVQWSCISIFYLPQGVIFRFYFWTPTCHWQAATFCWKSASNFWHSKVVQRWRQLFLSVIYSQTCTGLKTVAMWHCVSWQFRMIFTLTPHTSPVFFVSAISQQYLQDFRIMLHRIFICQGCCMAWAGSWIVMFPKTYQSQNTGNQLHTFATQPPGWAKTYNLNSWKWLCFSPPNIFKWSSCLSNCC